MDCERRLTFLFGVGARSIVKKLSRLEEKVDYIMSQVDAIKTAVAEQSEAISNMQQRVTADVETLRTELSDALAEKPELNEVLNSIISNTQAINTVDPVVESLPAGGEVTRGDTTPDPVSPEATPETEGSDAGTDSPVTTPDATSDDTGTNASDEDTATS